MVDSIFNLFNMAAEAVTSWFSRIFIATGMGYVYLGGFLLFCFIRFVFLPMTGKKMGSDFARSSKSVRSETSSSKELTVIN